MFTATLHRALGSEGESIQVARGCRFVGSLLSDRCVWRLAGGATLCGWAPHDADRAIIVGRV